MFTYVEPEKSARIKVIGVGGAGGNAINNMIASNLQGVKFIAANTGTQSGNQCTHLGGPKHLVESCFFDVQDFPLEWKYCLGSAVSALLG